MILTVCTELSTSGLCGSWKRVVLTTGNEMTGVHCAALPSLFSTPFNWTKTAHWTHNTQTLYSKKVSLSNSTPNTTICISLSNRSKCLTTKFLLSITNSIELSPSWGANGHSENLEILHLLWNLNAHYQAHKSSPLVLVTCHMNAAHNLIATSLRYISKEQSK